MELTLKQSDRISYIRLDELKQHPYGLSLKCLGYIAEKLTKLTELTIQLQAAPTDSLTVSAQKFTSPILVQIVDSFTNFMCDGFDFHQAAYYIHRFVR